MVEIQNISIIIPFYIVDKDTKQMTMDCIDSFKSTMDKKDELILCDDCSPYKHEIPSIKPENNLGNAGIWNFGIKNSKNPIILIADNDTISYKWRDQMIDCLKKYSIVFPITFDGFGKTSRQLAGYFFMFKRNLIDKIGYFDEIYGSYYEDTDFFKRTIESGGGLGIAEDTFIFHKSKGTFNRIWSSNKQKKMFERNKKIYEDRFGSNYPYLST